MPNLFSHLPTTLPEELTTVLAESTDIRIECIVSTGQASPAGFWYDQEDQEWVAVLRGEATLRYEDGEVLHMTSGDYVLIPAHRKHRVEKTSAEEPTVWLAVFYRN